jgi:hypothetical protein
VSLTEDQLRQTIQTIQRGQARTPDLATAMHATTAAIVLVEGA